MSPSHGYYNLEYEGRRSFHTYTPSPLQEIEKIIIDDELSEYLINAHRLLGKLDGMFRYIPDMDELAYALSHHEARCSYNIEKQESMVAERFGLEPSKVPADKIITAIEMALLQPTKTFIREKILFDCLCETHKHICVGEYKEAGQLRKTQIFSYPIVTVFGGPPKYNPPNPKELLTVAEDLVDYLNSESKLDSLVQIALVYYQLTTIRPFTNASGLLERASVNFLLVSMGILSRPLLCFSEYLVSNDVEFRDALRLVRDYGRGFEVWIKFFLKSLVIAAEKTERMLTELHELRQSDLRKLHNCEKFTSTTLILYRHLWKEPVVEVRHITETFSVSYNTAAKAVATLCNLNILEQFDAKTRYRKFGYKKILDICEGIHITCKPMCNG